MTKTFDTGTLKGLKAAERYQSRMYERFEYVTVRPIGLDRVQITTSRQIQSRNLGQAPDVVPDRQA